MQKKYILFIILAIVFKSFVFGQQTPIAPADTGKYNKYSLPSISAGVGIMTPFCNISTYDGKILQVGRFNTAGTFAVEQRWKSCLGVSLDALKGSICAVDDRPDRHLNFKTDITQGSLNIKFHFDNGFILNKTSMVAPYLSVGFGYMAFEAYGDLRDKNGKLYNYWPDGTIRDQPFDPDNPQNGSIIVRDYKFETKLDSLNKYSHHAFIVPVGGGINFKFSDIIEANISSYYYFTQTDALDNLPYQNATKFKLFDKHNDSYLYTNITVQFNFGGKTAQALGNKNYEGVNFNQIYTLDSDSDGVPDYLDKCPDTPKGVKVDKNGCPLDSDGDGVPDYLDKEPNTPKGNVVDENGVTISPQMIQDKYIRDSLIMAGILVLDKDSSHATSDVDENLVKNGSWAYYNSLKNINNHNNNYPTDKAKGIVYHVQIGSLASPDSSVYFQEKYNINEKIYVTPSNGSYKYSVGNFTNLDSAKQYANDIKAKTGIDGFVVAYNKDGTKYTPPANNNVVANNNTTNNNNVASNNNTTDNNVATNTNNNNVPNNSNNNVGTNNNTNNTNTNTSEMSPAGSIVYRAQIGTLASPDSVQYFQRTYNLKEKIYVTAGNGVYKYSVGNFNDYNAAKQFANNLKASTGLNSFVVTYKNGTQVPTFNNNPNNTNVATNTNVASNNNVPGNNVAVKNNYSMTTIDPADPGSIIYRAQIGSLVSPDYKSYFKQQFKITDEIFIDAFQGTYKYSVGTFKTYAEARKYANGIKDKTGINSFVIAFQKGFRVSTPAAKAVTDK